MSDENKELWEWFEKKFGEDAMNRFYCYEVNELIKEVKRRCIPDVAYKFAREYLSAKKKIENELNISFDQSELFKIYTKKVRKVAEECGYEMLRRAFEEMKKRGGEE